MLRSTLGPQNHDEYVQALAKVKTCVDAALTADSPATARRFIANAHGELGRADTRLAVATGPSARPA